MTLDENGHPWLAGYNGQVLHLDLDEGYGGDWAEPILVGEGRRLRGLQIDQEGQAWIAANDPCGVVMVDTKTSELVYENIELTDCMEPVGVSIDMDGQVWLPDFGANAAYRLDPDDLTSARTLGLNGPYTYSDMTGAGLRLVVQTPVG
jgi:streptogramin lyase